MRRFFHSLVEHCWAVLWERRWNDRMQAMRRRKMLRGGVEALLEQMLQAKDLMYKSHRNKESFFSDDGFAIGVAYILAIILRTVPRGSYSGVFIHT